MNTSVQALVALDDEIDRGLVDTLVAGDAKVTVLDYVEVGGSTASGYGAGDVLIVAAGDYSTQVREYISEAARQHPNRPIVLLAPVNGYARDAFAMGVEDIVALPGEQGAEIEPWLPRQLKLALEKAAVRRQGIEAERPIGSNRMICVLGLKGGSGKTLVSTNLGAALAQEGHDVALVDLDLQFGDLALAMGISPDRTIYDLVRSGGSLDAEKLRDFMVEHSSGARALLAPLRPDQASFVQVPFLREVLRLLRETHGYVIVDTPPNFTPEVIAAVDMSSDVVVVAMRDTLSLKNTKLGLETLERMGYDPRAVRIVLNRANTNVGINRQDVVGILGRDADVLVPSHRDITRSVNQGQPIVTQSHNAASKAFKGLAKAYHEETSHARKASANGSQPSRPHASGSPAKQQPEEDTSPRGARRRRLFGKKRARS